MNSKKWYQVESKFLDEFEGRYAEFINTQVGLCEKYEKECLQVSVYKKLIKRANELIEQFEAFFKKLDAVQEKLDDSLADNISETDHSVGKTVYVLGRKEDKESIYQTLDFELDSSNVKINKNVIDAIYGRLCAEKRPSDSENAAYLDISVVTAFLQETISAFRKKIDDDKNNSEIVDMDIYTALCKESDIEQKPKDGKKTKAGDLDDIDLETGEVKNSNRAAQRYREAFVACEKKLFRMAAPFLIHETEKSDNPLGTVITRPKTFWGFSPDVAMACPFIGAELGVNADLQTDDAYPKNELYCYRAVYGLAAAYIPKFNELKGGDYYTNYSAEVGSMVLDAEGKQGERALVRTPHLDKNWHKILPYITEEKQRQDQLEFFHGFWLAIAYGVIRVDQNGNLYIRRSVDGGFGSFIDNDIAIMYKNNPVTKTDVAKLIHALRADKAFAESDIPKLEARFKAELEEMATYVGTDVLKGLTKKNDLNPIDVVARYNEGLGQIKSISATLIGALEKIARELAERYNVDRSESRLDEAKYRICRKVYDSSKRIKGKAGVFGCWEAAFKQYKINKDVSTEDSSK